jgi:hypothetical protein
MTSQDLIPNVKQNLKASTLAPFKSPKAAFKQLRETEVSNADLFSGTTRMNRETEEYNKAQDRMYGRQSRRVPPSGTIATNGMGQIK